MSRIKNYAFIFATAGSFISVPVPVMALTNNEQVSVKLISPRQKIVGETHDLNQPLSPVQNQDRVNGTYVLVTDISGKPQDYSLVDNNWVEGNAAPHITTNFYSKNTKTFISFGGMSDSYKKSLGYELEIIPLSHPNKIHPGDSPAFKILYMGEPLANASMQVFEQATYHSAAPQIVKTNNLGEAVASFARPGKYAVSVSHLGAYGARPSLANGNLAATVIINVSEKVKETAQNY